MTKATPLPEDLCEAILKADKIVLASINPFTNGHLLDSIRLGEIELPQGKNGWVLETLQEMLDQWEGIVFMCFEPHHALQIFYQKTVWDLIICFECSSIWIYRDREIAGYTSTGYSDIFTNLLQENGITVIGY